MCIDGGLVSHAVPGVLQSAHLPFIAGRVQVQGTIPFARASNSTGVCQLARTMHGCFWLFQFVYAQFE